MLCPKKLKTDAFWALQLTAEVEILLDSPLLKTIL